VAEPAKWVASDTIGRRARTNKPFPDNGTREGSMFFFEKKNQKTFNHCARCRRKPVGRGGRNSLVDGGTK